jgi:toxin CptA
MWSNTSATAFIIRPEPSRRLALWLCLLHGLALTGLIAVTGTLALLVLPLLFVSLAWHLRGIGFFRSGEGVSLRFQASGMTQLKEGEGAWQEVRVLPSSLCLPGVCVLQLQVAGRRRCLALAADCADPRSLRRLRQRLLAAQGDEPDSPGGIRERIEALGILRPRTPQETQPMPSEQANEQERLEALLSDDPDHVYSDEELDAIEEIDAEMALRIDRVQTAARRQGGVVVADGPIDEGRVREAVEEARKILMQDGGDIEFVAIEERTVRVRLKGACVGCPRSTLDLRNVVERLVRSREPGVARVVNEF